MANPTDDRNEDSPEKVRQGWMQRRQEKIANEIARNRRGEYKVPTWVLAAGLVLLLAAWAAVVVFS